MKQERFERSHGPLWDDLERWLQGEPTLADEDVPAGFRRLCHHAALAGDRSYGAPLNDRLQALALALHQRLYQHREGGLGLWRIVARDYPARVRAEWRLVLFSCLLLFGTWAAAFLVVRRNPDLVYLVLSPAQAAEMVRMYDPASREFAGMAGAMRNVAMFGHYISNNIGIDFQNFGSGLLLGAGPIASMIFNGVYGGAIMAHLTNQGLVATFYGFVSGHSALELVGAALSGAAGLRLGLGLMHPGRRPRLEALKDAGRRGAYLLMGAATLTFMAACIEAFWSANRWVPWKTKVGVGSALWLLLLAYFLLAGRRRVSR